MSAFGTKLCKVEGGRISFWCPGCNMAHQIGVEAPAKVVWGFNGDGERPTFTPSVLVQGKRRLTDEEYARVMAGETVHLDNLTCHSFVTDGRIQFLGDCSHALAGQTVDLPEWPS